MTLKDPNPQEKGIEGGPRIEPMFPLSHIVLASYKISFNLSFHLY